MKMNILIPAALLAAFTFSACGSDGDSDNKETAKTESANVESFARDSDNIQTAGIDPANVEWVAIEAHEKYADPELVKAFPHDSLGNTFEADYKLLLPKTKDGSEHPFLKEVVLKLMSRLDTLAYTKKEAPEVLLEQYVREQLDKHKAMVKDLLPVFEDPRPYKFVEEHSLIDSLVYTQKGIVSIISQWYAFTGGAHGNFGDVGWNFDLNRAIILSQRDLFEEESFGEINGLLRRTLMNDYGVPDAKVLKDSLHIDAAYIRMNDNFYFDGDGITYIYQPYEAAPYAVGQILVHLPFTALAPYLRDEYATLAR